MSYVWALIFYYGFSDRFALCYLRISDQKGKKCKRHLKVLFDGGDKIRSLYTSVKLASELGEITFSTGKQKLTPGLHFSGILVYI